MVVNGLDIGGDWGFGWIIIRGWFKGALV